MNTAHPESPALAGLALIFDMDGVLLDSNPAHREAWAAFNRRYGLETTDEMFEFMYGKRNDEIVRGYFGSGLTEEEIARRGAEKEQLYREMIAPRLEQMLLPGLRQFLQRCAACRVALATNAEPENVAFLLDGAALRQYFQVVVDGHQVSRPKPYPDVYLRAAELLGVSPSDAIVFEDSLSGVEAARAAGMRVIGLCTTYVNLPGTILCIDNFLSGELYSWLATENRPV